MTVTDANGCAATSTSTVIVHPLPSADAGVNSELCIGESQTLVASGGTTYLWNTGDTNNTINVTPTATTTYSVTVTDNNGCTDVDDVEVLVHDLPTASVLGLEEICIQETIDLIASGGTSYLWSEGSTTALLTVAPLVTSTYSVTVTDANGCTGCLLYTSPSPRDRQKSRMPSSA